MEYVTVLAHELLPPLLLLLQVVLLVLIRAAYRWLSARLGVEKLLAKKTAEELAFDLAVLATGLVDERARKRLVRDGELTPGAKKLEAALKWGMSEAERQGLKIDPAHLADLIEARLGLTREAE